MTDPSNMVAAIIVAAGSSSRMGFDKLTADLGGRPVLARSIEAFENARSIDLILLVVNPARVGEFEPWKKRYGYQKLAAVVAGGEQRHLSVANGLAKLPQECKWVAVHDGARPLITPGVIDRCVQAARQHGAVSCARPLVETIKRTDADGVVRESVSRDNLWAMETPQVFSRALLQQAYKEVLEDGAVVTDEVSALQWIGMDVRVVANDLPNPKITFAADLALAELMVRRGGR